MENLNIYSRQSKLNIAEIKQRIREKQNSIDVQIKNLPQAKTIEHSRNNSHNNSLEMKPLDL